MTRKNIPKKSEKLIDLIVEIPSLESVRHEGLVLGGVVNKKQIVTDYLIRTLEIVTNNTQHEEITQEIISKCIVLLDDEDLAVKRE